MGGKKEDKVWDTGRSSLTLSSSLSVWEQEDIEIIYSNWLFLLTRLFQMQSVDQEQKVILRYLMCWKQARATWDPAP